MMAKRVIPRVQAHRDVENAVDHYAGEAGSDIALEFVAALERAYRMMERHPAAGSSRYAHELDLPGLRHRRLGRFPWLAFYLERHDHIDVWRVLALTLDHIRRRADRECVGGHRLVAVVASAVVEKLVLIGIRRGFVDSMTSLSAANQTLQRSIQVRPGAETPPARRLHQPLAITCGSCPDAPASIRDIRLEGG